MEDTLKGMIITGTLIGIFILAIVNFSVGFPVDQGVSFNNSQKYLSFQSLNDEVTPDSLRNIQNQSDSSFKDWDVTVGFMGTNQIKDNKGGIVGLISGVISNMKTMASYVFSTTTSSDHPVMQVFVLLTLMATIYGGYMVSQLIRTGR